MNYRIVVVLACLVFAGCSTTQAGKIKELQLREGDDVEQGLQSPIFDGSAVKPLRFLKFSEDYDRDAKLFRPRKPKFVGGNVRPDLGPEIHVGAFLTQALDREASLMGFISDDGGWVLGGSIEHLHMEYRAPTKASIGAVLYYGLIDVRIDMTSPDGDKDQTTLRLHFYSPGGGGRDKTRIALERMIMTAAQEILLRMNQLYFKAPPHPSVSQALATLQTSGIEGHDDLVDAIGLAGYERAVPLFLEQLGMLEDEDDRSVIIRALARIRSPEMVRVLTSRYGEEDEDCRWYTLKAMAYLGTPDAIEFVTAHGLRDEKESLRDLAENIRRGNGQ